MYCFRCGKPIREDADYCTYCGTYLKEDLEPDAGKFTEKDIPVSLPERENPPVRVKRKAHSIWLAVVLGVFVCLAAAAVVLAGIKASEYRNLVVLYTPQMAQMPNLQTLMNEWGLDVAPQTEVVATSDGSYVQYTDYIIANLTDEVDLQGKSSYGYLLAPMSCPVDVLWNGRIEITTSVLMKSPSDAERLTYNEETEKMETVASGEENLIAMGTKMYKYDSNAYRNSNVVAVGCGLFIDGSFIGDSATAFSNKDYAIDLFKYLTDTTGTTAAVASNRVQLYAQDITMSDAEVKGWGLYTFMIGIPVAFLVVGVVVFFKRRHL